MSKAILWFVGCVDAGGREGLACGVKFRDLGFRTVLWCSRKAQALKAETGVLSTVYLTEDEMS